VTANCKVVKIVLKCHWVEWDIKPYYTYTVWW